MSGEQPATSQPQELALPAIGDVVSGRFRIEEKLGEGGMGAVFRARDAETDGLVALKVMRPQEVVNTDAVKRFTREARAARAIASEHVATVLQVGQLAGGLPYIVLELLVGLPFDRVIVERAPLPVEQAVDYLLQACEGIAQAHALGIVHRDLKPANLYLFRRADGTEVVKVLDFGIAKTTLRLDPNTDGISLTETSSTLGSPQYMSPEQLRSSKHVDARTDIWALGLIFFKLLTGQPAFPADTVGQHFAMILSETPTPLRDLRADAPTELEQVIECCLEKQPADRFQDVAQLADALAAFGAPTATQRAARIREILANAGAESQSGPRQRHAPKQADAAPPSSVTRRVGGEVSGATARSWGTSTGAPQSPAASRSVWVTIGALAALGVGGVGGYLWLGARATSPGASAVPSVEVLVDPADAPGAADTRSAPSSALPSASVAVRLVLEPADATVLVDGEPATGNPVLLPKGGTQHELLVRASGYEPDRRTVVAGQDQELQISLRRVGAASPVAAKGAAAPVPVAGTGAAPASTTAAPTAPLPGPTVKPKGPLEDTL